MSVPEIRVGPSELTSGFELLSRRRVVRIACDPAPGIGSVDASEESGNLDFGEQTPCLLAAIAAKTGSVTCRV